MEENNKIKGLITPSSGLKNPRLFLLDLFEDGNELISSENTKYQKYKRKMGRFKSLREN